MTPSPLEFNSQGEDPNLSGERVVVSGMSGLFPKAPHVKAFSEILYNKVDPITSDIPRWDFKHPELSNYLGMVPNLNRFDSQFFKINHRTGYTMDVTSRKLLEQTYQAIYDAGISPENLRGKNIGVYIGTCFTESETACLSNDSSLITGIMGSSKSLFANRISYWLDVKGPSYNVDQSCCSSIAALEAAYRAIQAGQCEAAIVGAGNICLYPHTMIHFGRVISLSPNGKTKSFDENADGCVKSEAIGVLFLQKAKNALRIYGDIVHVNSTFTSVVEGENGPKFGFYRDAGLMARYLKEFYKKANVSPNSVDYVEAFGAGSHETDKAELDAFEEVFCVDRKDPLVVGSVMSNIGYTEAASGITSITKILIGYQKGEIAANLHFENPRLDIHALKDKRITIAQEHQPIDRSNSSYTAINNLSYYGVNGHVLLHHRFKPKNLDRYNSSLPRLVTVSGRNVNAVQHILDDLKSRPIDPEELALLYNIHENRISGHLERGYAILATNSDGKTLSLGESVQHFDDVERPLWFVYSGMGSQWIQMGVHLMQIPIFAASIKRCHKVLKPKGIDLINVLTSEDKTIFNNILHAFVGITAVHIGLTDILREIGIVPENIIGHSLGEVACAYADNTLTLEQTILVSYARGRVSIDVPVVKGSMAAVGLGYQQIKDICPEEITVACHNGPDSCTLSGPFESVTNFVENLTSQGIFAKEVQTCNIAYHSKYIKDMSDPHMKILREIIKKPVTRSKRWISTSVPQDRWHEDIAKYSSPEYLDNNMSSPVLFEEVLKLVPSNAVLIEIAPHGLLQAILKRSLPSNCRHIPLTMRKHADNAIHLLKALGSLFNEGYNPQVCKLYPKVEFPVSTETASLSHLVGWTHDEKWDFPLYVAGEKHMSSTTKHLITLHDEEYTYLRGNIVGGRVIYPFAAALVLAWDTLAMSLGEEKKNISVHFRDIHLFAQPILHDQRHLKLIVKLHNGTGKFEISDESSKVATGYIFGNLKDLILPEMPLQSTEPLELESRDIYELLQEKNYSYRDEFRSLYKASASLTEAKLVWNDNWVTLIDGILQLNALKVFHSTVCTPTYIRRICIDVDEHKEKIKTTDDKKIVIAHVDDKLNWSKCGGITFDNVTFHKLPPLVQDSVILKTVQFFPHFQTSITNEKSAFEIYIEVLNENVNKNEINAVGVINDSNETNFEEFKRVIKQNGININYCEVLEEKMMKNKDVLSKADLVLTKNLLMQPNVFKILQDILHQEAFILNLNDEIYKNAPTDSVSTLPRIIMSINTGEMVLNLIKLRPETKSFTTVLSITSQDSISQLESKLKNLPLNKEILIVAIAPVLPGLKEQIRKWRREFGYKISMITFNKNMTKDEVINNIPDMAFSVFKNGVWGGEYLLPWQERSSINKDVILRSTQIGKIQSLKWIEAPEPFESGIIVNVHFAGVNDCDAKRATGIVPFKENQDCNYGMDYSGKTESGVPVMGLVRNGALRSKIVACPELLWNVPFEWSLEDAATVPLAYSMAFYCLKLKADITRGMSILILGGAGALGQAVISIALAYECQVFTTVSNHNKKQLLLKLFPKLDEKNIGYSRDILFGDTVLKRTEGEGCDIVITCATGELKDMFLNCCAYSGVTIDTVQILSKENYAFGLKHLTKQRSYMVVDFSSIFDYLEDMESIKHLVSEGIEKGYVRPLTHVTYGPKDVVTAFKLLESSHRSGRVLINLSDSLMEADSRFTCSPNNLQIVFCDDVIGIQFTEKLIHHGARKVLLNCSALSGHLQYKMRAWTKIGVDVNISSNDLTKTGVIDSTLKDITSKGQVEGIFTLLKNTNNEQLETNIAKLDVTSRKLCPYLKYFVVASTSNTFGDKIYSTRRQDELPILVIHLPSFEEDTITTRSTATISRRVAIDATLKTLATPTANVFTYVKEKEQTSLLQELASIADIEIPTNVSGDTTFQALGVGDNKTYAVKAYLRDAYNIYFEEDVIRYLTVEKIRDIEKNSNWRDFEDIKGLEIFYSHFNPDEILASTPIILMKTRAKYWREFEFDGAVHSLCIIPGLEGGYDRFQLMCERLKLPAFTLQTTYHSVKPQESIQSMAQTYAQILTKKMKIKSDFHILGYESGILLALETAKLLERDGRKGTIFCIGQSPEELKTTIEDMIDSFRKEKTDLEDAVAKHMVNLIKGDKKAFDKIETDIKTASNWNDKLEICVEELVGHNGHTSQYIQVAINTALERIMKVRSYKMKDFQLVSKIVLIHPLSTYCPNTMQRFSKQPIAIHEIDTPLGHLAQDLRCASIINQYLDQEILNLFEHNNRCETYLFNGNTYLFGPCPENTTL